MNWIKLDLHDAFNVGGTTGSRSNSDKLFGPGEIKKSVRGHVISTLLKRRPISTNRHFTLGNLCLYYTLPISRLHSTFITRLKVRSAGVFFILAAVFFFLERSSQTDYPANPDLVEAS